MWIAALVLAVALSACGGSDNESGDAPAAAGRSSAFPVTIEHRYGSTRIPVEPERVVTVGSNEHDYALALGVKPVAVREWFGERPHATWSWAQDELGDAKPVVLPVAELNFEQIAGLRPDLILGVYGGLSKTDYARLSRIAPTVTQSDEHVEYGVPWQAQLRLTGRALGRAERAEALITELEAQFASARQAHPEFAGKTAAFAAYFAGFSAYASQDPRSRFLTPLGFEIPAEIDKRAGDQFFVELSSERLRLLDQDVLVTYGPTPDKRKDVLESPLYERLNAVREGRDVYLDGEDELTGALSFVLKPAEHPVRAAGARAAAGRRPSTAIARRRSPSPRDRDSSQPVGDRSRSSAAR